MGSTHRFIEDPNEASQVTKWFLDLDHQIEVHNVGTNSMVHFKDFGEVILDASGKVDSSNSPIVTIFLPRVVKGSIWTVGEVHFLPSPLKEKFPQLQKISTLFQKWLRTNETIFSNKPGSVWRYDYYLEGSIRNFDSPVIALPSGLRAIEGGQYFVSDDDGPVLDKLCQTLRLRGIQCED